MLSHAHVAEYIYGSLWAIRPEKLAVILDLLEFRMQGGRLSAEEIQERIGAVSRPASRVTGAVAVLPLWGVIAHRANLINESSGGTSVERFAQGFRAALADPAVSTIVLDVDSPGGTVNGVAELADEIHGARGSKPILAVANSQAASAAYWIASAADSVSVTPSGDVGSIGVFAAHQDRSKASEQEGVKTTLVSAGRYKTEGNPYEPLTEEARAHVQSRVDDYYEMFVQAVARNRGVSASDVRGGFGEGRTVGAREAKRLGMVDRVESLDDALARLTKGKAVVRQMGASALDERRRLLLT